MGKLKILTGSQYYPLFDKIKRCFPADTHLLVVTDKFSNENIKVKIEQSVRGADTFIIQPCYPDHNERLMELFIIIDALKHASAGRITTILPYFSYARSDKKDEPRISITARLIAELLKAAGTDRVLTMQLHSPQIHGFFSYPLDHLLPIRNICNYFNKKGILNRDYVVVAPDAGSAKNAGKYATMLSLPLAIIDKRRVDDSEKPVIKGVLGDIEGRKCFLFDDEIASGGSIFKSTDKLIELGAKSVEAFAVHGVLTNNAVDKIMKSKIFRVYITDTIWRPEYDKCDKLEIISVADMFVQAINCVHNNESITQVFERSDD
jgi:ribose-phosphate pyrophosphokinase